MCYEVTLDQSQQIPKSFFDSFYQSKLPSFKAYPTDKITLTADDFSNIITSHGSYINDVCQITGRPHDPVLLDFAQYHKTK